MKKYKILFADLDGTLINTITGNTFPKGIWDMQFNFAVLDKIKELNPDYIFIVTNQGGIEKGFVNKEHFLSKMYYILKSIKEYLGQMNIIDFDYCTSNNKDDINRKPNIGMFISILNCYRHAAKCDKSDMLMIGDASGKPGQFSDSDKQTAINFGIDYMDVEDFINIDLENIIEEKK